MAIKNNLILKNVPKLHENRACSFWAMRQGCEELCCRKSRGYHYGARARKQDLYPFRKMRITRTVPILKKNCTFFFLMILKFFQMAGGGGFVFDMSILFHKCNKNISAVLLCTLYIFYTWLMFCFDAFFPSPEKLHFGCRKCVFSHRGREDDLSFFKSIFLLIDFHCTFSISYKILPDHVYYYCFSIWMW